jgi:hypothetical protein
MTRLVSDSGRMTGNSEVIHMLDQRAYRKFGVLILDLSGYATSRDLTALLVIWGLHSKVRRHRAALDRLFYRE